MELLSSYDWTTPRTFRRPVDPKPGSTTFYVLSPLPQAFFAVEAAELSPGTVVFVVAGPLAPVGVSAAPEAGEVPVVALEDSEPGAFAGAGLVAGLSPEIVLGAMIGAGSVAEPQASVGIPASSAGSVLFSVVVVGAGNPGHPMSSVLPSTGYFASSSSSVGAAGWG